MRTGGAFITLPKEIVFIIEDMSIYRTKISLHFLTVITSVHISGPIDSC